MDSPVLPPAAPVPVAPPRRQQLKARIFWFLVGSIVNYLMISTPFRWLTHHTSLSLWAISACSISFSTIFFFGWNYWVNFRTTARKRDVLPRYVLAVICMWGLSSLTLGILKHYNAHLHFSLLGRIPLDLDIVATQFFLGGLKFFLYNLWVFPPARAPQEAEA